MAYGKAKHVVNSFVKKGRIPGTFRTGKNPNPFKGSKTRTGGRKRIV
jgi:hypothetical protein